MSRQYQKRNNEIAQRKDFTKKKVNFHPAAISKMEWLGAACILHCWGISVRQEEGVGE